MQLFVDLDQRLDGVIAGGHGLEQFRQPAQRTFAVHKILCANHARLDEFQRAL
jgi:hypothetical protein